MENNLIYVFLTVLSFIITLAAYKQGKVWLYSWMVLAMITSIPLATLIVEVFGFAVNAGMALYVSLFLATDMLTERYGRKAALLSVRITTLSILVFMVIGQIMLKLDPAVYSIEMYNSLSAILGASFRIALGAIASYIVAQYLDIFVYDKLRQLTQGKMLWLRNNVSTMTTQVLDNFVFFAIAFYGVIPNWWELFLVATVVRIGVSILDTPFIYLSKRITPNDSMA